MQAGGSPHPIHVPSGISGGIAHWRWRGGVEVVAKTSRPVHILKDKCAGAQFGSSTILRSSTPSTPTPFSFLTHPENPCSLPRSPSDFPAPPQPAQSASTTTGDNPLSTRSCLSPLYVLVLVSSPSSPTFRPSDIAPVLVHHPLSTTYQLPTRPGPLLSGAQSLRQNLFFLLLRPPTRQSRMMPLETSATCRPLVIPSSSFLELRYVFRVIMEKG